jgi:hypothetical protein
VLPRATLAQSHLLAEHGHVIRPQPTSEGIVTVEVEWHKGALRMERCDHEGTTEPLGGLRSVSRCTECNKTWPSSFGAGAPTLRIVDTTTGSDS